MTGSVKPSTLVDLIKATGLNQMYSISTVTESESYQMQICIMNHEIIENESLP